MRAEPPVPARWVLTASLVVLGILAALVAPRLEPKGEEPELEAATDLCLSVGQFECCYKEPKQ